MTPEHYTRFDAPVRIAAAKLIEQARDLKFLDSLKVVILQEPGTKETIQCVFWLN